MEVSRLGVEAEPQLPACPTATAMPEPSCICDLHHSSRHCWILNPLSEARDRTCVLMDASRLRFHWATMGSPMNSFTNVHNILATQRINIWVRYQAGPSRSLQLCEEGRHECKEYKREVIFKIQWERAWWKCRRWKITFEGNGCLCPEMENLLY